MLPDVPLLVGEEVCSIVFSLADAIMVYFMEFRSLDTLASMSNVEPHLVATSTKGTAKLPLFSWSALFEFRRKCSLAAEMTSWVG